MGIFSLDWFGSGFLAYALHALMLCIGVKDVLKNLNVTNGTESGDCSIEEKMVDGRRWARATTPRKLRELQVIGNKRRRIINDIIVHKNIIGQRQTREMDVNGVDAKDIVRSIEIKNTAIIARRRQTSTKRRRLLGNRLVLDSFDNRRRRAELGLEASLVTRLGAERHENAKR